MRVRLDQVKLVSVIRLGLEHDEVHNWSQSFKTLGKREYIV